MEFKKRRRPQKKHKKWPRRIFALLLILVVAAAGWFYYDNWTYQAKNPNDTTVTMVTIKSKESPKAIGQQLKQAGLIRSSQAFEKYAKQNGSDSLLAATYPVSPVQSIAQIYDELTQGSGATPVLSSEYTFISNDKTADQSATTLERAAGINKDALLSAYTNQDLIKKAQAKYPTLFLNSKTVKTLYDFVYPGIYKFKKEKSADDFVMTLLKESNKSLQPYYAELKANKMPASTAILLAENGGKKEFDRRLAFIKKIAPYSQELQKQYGILASISIAQAIHESNWDDSVLSSKYNNYYGVKTDDTTAGKSVVLQTQEVENGQTVTKNARFAAYDSYQDSMKAHAKTIANGNTWNANQFADVLAAKTYQDAAQALSTDGYATDPSYPKLIIQIIENWNLSQYDQN
ncbi:endolytic transglycosylase MltG [Fructobacillus ficulneus]|uniref:N-acetylmuramidase n=1 Tax=Fructobacillus ficulneus TaxID=157463 RepID=A0A0K8MGI2_9LACO|nr:endolytic transglycosylase MltG [Fructobacillus ficulneus]GAO99572.1 N-acetylmuramidase [Fructobacillus ficulneus]